MKYHFSKLGVVKNPHNCERGLSSAAKFIAQKNIVQEVRG
jgi:hypothetical protein